VENLKYILPLLAGIFLAISTINDKYASQRHTSPVHITFWFWLVGVIVGLIGLFILKVEIIIDLQLILRTFLASILLVIYTLLMYTTAKYSELSKLSLLTKSAIPVYTLGGIFLLQETLSELQYVGIILIFLAIVTININNLKFTLSRWTFLGILTGVLAGVVVIINKVLLGTSAPLLFQLLIGFWIVIMFFPFVLRDWIKYRRVFSKIEVVPLVTTAVFSYLGDALIYMSYSLGGYVSISNLLPQIRTPITVIYGILFLNEKQNLKLKIIALVLFILGVILLKY
jgi:drug/metabolite transporter (DMT)-like permease